MSGEVVRVNRAFTEMVGRSEQELLGHPAADLVHPDDADRLITDCWPPTRRQRDAGWSGIERRVAGAVGRTAKAEHAAAHPAGIEDDAGPPSYAGPVRYLRPDGSVIFAYVTECVVPATADLPDQVFAQAVDLTAARNAIVTVVEDERWFRTAFDNAPIGMALVSMDGRFLKVNSALCEVLQYSADDLLTMRVSELTHPDDLEEQIELSRQLLEGRIPAYQFEKRYLTAHGGILWALLASSLVRNEQGEPLHYIAQIRDISEPKRSPHRVVQPAPLQRGAGPLRGGP